MRGRRGAVRGLAAVLLAGAMLLAGGVLARPDGAVDAQASPAAAGRSDDPVAALQARLERVPGDHPGWAALALLYVDRARASGDPSWYGKAEAAARRSLQVQPEDNAGAHTALGSLQAARHEFAQAADSARAALAVNEYDATAWGVLTDALTELGRYDEAADALQRMADVDPGFPALARISYARELRGDVAGARQAMERALELAARPEDAAFAQLHLGELAWFYGGDLAVAAGHYERGVELDPESLALQAAQARVAAAQGRTAEALAAYSEVVAQVPVQQYLVEHGELLASVGRADEAREQFDVVRATVILLEENGAVADLETALFEADHGDPVAALDAAQAAYAKAPSVFAADALAWALHVNGRDAEALRYADEALALGMRRPSFLFHRGVIAASLGRDEQATRDLRAALESNPQFSPLHAEVARDLLAQLTA